MSDLETAIRSAEYATLRSELLQNKQYVFERPLLIITAAGVASVELPDKPAVVLLPISLVVVLLINLWFTVNRLRSIARIAAYVEVVLESVASTRWIGWEKSLRIHRKWMKTHSPEERKELLNPHIEPSAIPDAMTFYPLIFWLHAATVVLAVAVSGLSVMESPDIIQVVAFSTTLLVSLVFAGLCVGPYRPDKMRDLIEVQRAIWIVALGGEEAA